VPSQPITTSCDYENAQQTNHKEQHKYLNNQTMKLLRDALKQMKLKGLITQLVNSSMKTDQVYCTASDVCNRGARHQLLERSI